MVHYWSNTEMCRSKVKWGSCAFAGDFRKIGACCVGRCRHRPLQTDLGVHTDSSGDFRIRRCGLRRRAPGGWGFPEGGGEARVCLKGKGLKRFQCHSSGKGGLRSLACIPMIAYTTRIFKPRGRFFAKKRRRPGVENNLP